MTMLINPKTVQLRHTVRTSWLTMLFLAALHCGTDAYAQAPKQNDAASQALRKAQGLLRQLTEEKAALEAEKKVLGTELDKLRNDVAQLAPLKGQVEQYRVGLANSQSANGALHEQLSRAGQREQKLHEKLKEIIAEAKKIQNDNQLLVAAVQEREKWIGQCTENNASLIAVNSEMLDKYRDKGFWENLVEMEPITGIGKIASENLAETYQFRLEDLKATPFESTLNTTTQVSTGQNPERAEGNRNE
jgi:hypothetical protein